MRGAPRTDPGVRNYRTGLLPWVLTARRCCLPYPLQRRLQGRPALCPAPGTSKRIALGRPPSLNLLRRRRGRVTTVKPVHTAFVRRRLRYYGAVRLPAAVHRRLAPVGFTARTAGPPACLLKAGRSAPRPAAGPPSSCTESLRACMGSTTARGPAVTRASATAGMAFGSGERPRRPGRWELTRLNTQPTRTPTDACVAPLRTRRHGSGPARVATASPQDSLIPCSPSVTGASPQIPMVCSWRSPVPVVGR